MVDPVENGYAASMARPGGQITGVAGGHPGIRSKRVELLQQLVAGLAQAGYLWNATNPSFLQQFVDFQAIAHARGLDLQSIEFRTP
jgi:putative ABC transport system substrate-binding protein